MIYVGIIAPKPYLTGGHDRDNMLRLRLQDSIRLTLMDIIKKHAGTPVVGITGLSPGLEQDFAHIFIELKQRFEVYLAYQDQEDMWTDIINLEDYHNLLDKASEQHLLDDGAFNPKKILKRNIRILQKCDYTILVENPLISYEDVITKVPPPQRVIRVPIQ